QLAGRGQETLQVQLGGRIVRVGDAPRLLRQYELGKAVEGAVPTAVVSVAFALGRERPLRKRHQGLPSPLFESYGYGVFLERAFAQPNAGAIVPGRGKDQQFRRAKILDRP